MLWIDNVQFKPSGIVLLDPVDSGWLLSGPQIPNNPSLLSQSGVTVQGAAADGVTQVLLRIPANSGDSLTVNVLDENGQQESVQNEGGLFQLGGSPQSAQSTLNNVTVANTPNGPMAFVVYLPPSNFARGSQDYNSATRTVTFQVKSNSNPNYILTATANILRPPVVLVHGLWGEPGDWDRNGFTIPITGIVVSKADYYHPLLQGITATSPTYDPGILDLNNIPTSALGFSYNAGDAFNPGSVDRQIRQFISNFRHSNNVAAVTADVVAHSMGGDIVRTMALQPWFASNDTYGHGPIDKLITIGTPHLGTPLATDLLQDASKCVRQHLAKKRNASFITVTINGVPINGAVGDLQGNGFGMYLSPALQQLFDAGPLPFPMARVSATEDSSNLSGIDCSPDLFLNCLAGWLRDVLCRNDPLAGALTSTLWEPTVFGQRSDAIVPLISQLNNRTSTIVTLSGVIHSLGLAKLNFNPPTELDPTFGAVTTVVNLLNEMPNGPDFQ